MKKTRRPKKLALQVETLRQLEVSQLGAAQGASDSGVYCVTTTVFTEAACDTYSWFWNCAA